MLSIVVREFAAHENRDDREWEQSNSADQDKRFAFQRLVVRCSRAQISERKQKESFPNKRAASIPILLGRH